MSSNTQDLEMNEVKYSNPSKDPSQTRKLQYQYSYSDEETKSTEAISSDEGDFNSAEEEGSDPELDEIDLKRLYPVIYRLLDPETGSI